MVKAEKAQRSTSLPRPYNSRANRESANKHIALNRARLAIAEAAIAYVDGMECRVLDFDERWSTLQGAVAALRKLEK